MTKKITSKKIETINKLRRVSKTLCFHLNKKIEEFDLTWSQGRILMYIFKETIENENEVNQLHLEQKFSLSKSTISGYIDRLVKKEYVNRITNGSKVSLEVTSLGHSIIEQFENYHDFYSNKAFEGIKENDIDTLVKIIDKVLENLGEEKENETKN